jgi:hypothetical protein
VLRGQRSVFYRNTAKCIEGNVFCNTTQCSSSDSDISEECAVPISGKEEPLLTFFTCIFSVTTGDVIYIYIYIYSTNIK